MSSACLMMTMLSWVETQSWVYRGKSLGLREEPCGVPVLIVSSEETVSPILATCGSMVLKHPVVGSTAVQVL